LVWGVRFFPVSSEQVPDELNDEVASESESLDVVVARLESLELQSDVPLELQSDVPLELQDDVPVNLGDAPKPNEYEKFPGLSEEEDEDEADARVGEVSCSTK